MSTSLASTDDGEHEPVVEHHECSECPPTGDDEDTVVYDPKSGIGECQRCGLRF